MKRTIVWLLTAVLTITGAIGCTTGAGPKEGAGTLLGAVGGGLAGAQFGKGSGQMWAVGIGTLAGALLGREVGVSLDRADRQYMEQTAQQSLESNRSNQTSRWRNPDSGNQGSFTPTETYYTGDNRPCREYQQTVTIGGRPEQVYGTACREADGSWRIRQ